MGGGKSDPTPLHCFLDKQKNNAFTFLLEEKQVVGARYFPYCYCCSGIVIVVQATVPPLAAPVTQVVGAWYFPYCYCCCSGIVIIVVVVVVVIVSVLLLLFKQQFLHLQHRWYKWWVLGIFRREQHSVLGNWRCPAKKKNSEHLQK